MLIGSMLLYVLALFERVDQERDKDDVLLQNNGPHIPSPGLMLSIFLRFAEDHQHTCKLNEDGWKYSVVEKADKHGINFFGVTGIEKIVKKIRRTIERDESVIGEWIERDWMKSWDHYDNCYKCVDMSGVMTVAKLQQGTRRSWACHEFVIEVRCQVHSILYQLIPG